MKVSSINRRQSERNILTNSLKDFYEQNVKNIPFQHKKESAKQLYTGLKDIHQGKYQRNQIKPETLSSRFTSVFTKEDEMLLEKAFYRVFQ